MRIILLGPPGAGKGTQAEFISKQLNIPRISTGDMLRAAITANTSVGQAVKSLMEKGLLVPEQIVIDMLNERIALPDCANGYLLDGFPRTIHQAEVLDKAGIAFDAVIEIRVPDNEIIKRLSGRRVHLSSGRTYHITANPPKSKDKDDITNEPLTHREDDKEESIRKRLEIYHQQTEPMIEWFKRHSHQYHYASISGTGSIEEIRNQLADLIQESKAT